MTDLEILAALISAMIHDLGHSGLNNHYHSRTESSLAIRYNDSSILENFHISQAWRILKMPHNNFLGGLNKNDHRRFRQIVIQMILGTDMYRHGQHLQGMKELSPLMSVRIFPPRCEWRALGA